MKNVSAQRKLTFYVMNVILLLGLFNKEVQSQTKVYKRGQNVLKGKIANPSLFFSTGKYALRDSLLMNPRLRSLPFWTKISLSQRYRRIVPGVTNCNLAIPDVIIGRSKIGVIRSGTDYYNALSSTSTTTTNSTVSCTSTPINVTAHFSEQALFLPSTDLVYPGAIINGTTVPSGALGVYQLPNGVNRIPYRISGFFANSTGQPLYETVSTNYSRAEVIQKTNNLVMRQQSAVVSNTFTSEILEGTHREDLSIQLGARTTTHISPALSSLLTGIPLEIDAKQQAELDAQSNRQTNYLLIKIIRPYFSITADPTNDDPKNFFDNPNQIDCRGMYVASVTYGSMGYLLVKTHQNKSIIESALSYALSVGLDDSNVRTAVEAHLSQVIDWTQTRITSTVIGGPPIGGAQATLNIGSASSLTNYITSVPQWSPSIGVGEPIAYTLRFLTDDAAATLSVRSSFQIHECARIANRYELTLDRIECDTQEDYWGSDQIFGKIRAKRNSGSGITPSGWRTFWNVSRGNKIAIETGKSIDVGESRIYRVPLNSTNPTVNIQSRLKEYDFADPDDKLENDTNLNLRTGNRKKIPLSVGDARYYLHFSIRPVL